MCPSQCRTVAVTGASGYVGGVIARRLRDDGWHVVALTRSPTSNADEHRTWSLQTRQLPALADIDLLVHAAYDFTPTDWMDIEQVNVGGARRLFDAALDAGVQRLIHISSLAAFRGTRSRYGTAKLLTEAEATSRDGIVIRPGLVYGPRAGAMVAGLQKMADRLPVIPLIVGDHSPMLMAHEQDLADLVAAIAAGRELPAPGQPLVAANPEPITLRGLLTSLAGAGGRSPRFVPVPWRAVFSVLKGCERIGVRPPFRSDSALSLATANTQPFSGAIGPATMTFRPFRTADVGAATS
ncbi:MAG TPA: NAD-dependent epimerase/dehydratase family protein [Baekduia sp.]|nr:NAD-dependent epimerase/dehydratase family protein [Baekduia sp.]